MPVTERRHPTSFLIAQFLFFFLNETGPLELCTVAPAPVAASVVAASGFDSAPMVADDCAARETVGIFVIGSMLTPVVKPSRTIWATVSGAKRTRNGLSVFSHNLWESSVVFSCKCPDPASPLRTMSVAVYRYA